MKTTRHLFAVLMLGAWAPAIASATVISVNFHVDNDADAQVDHVLTAGEIAGLVPIDGQHWNNINIGTAGAHGTAGAIFTPTNLKDNSGNAAAAHLGQSVDSTWFVGYGASTAANANELGLAGHHDDLFNSYLGMNGPTNASNPNDAAVLQVTGLSSAFTDNGYKLILYSDTDRGSPDTPASQRTSTFIVTPNGGDLISVFVEDDPQAAITTFDGAYVPSDLVDDGHDYSNYVVINGLTADGFTLEILSFNGGRGGLSGFQIVAIPEPASLALLALGGVIALRRRR